MSTHETTRRRFLAYFSAIGLGHTLFPGTLYALHVQEGGPITPEIIEKAEKIIGLTFTPEWRERMAEDLNERLKDYEAIRSVHLENSVVPALQFNPTVSGIYPPARSQEDFTHWSPPETRRPSSETDLAFMTVAELSGLLRRREITSVELTELALKRLKKYDPLLKAVITLTEERAYAQARKADEELDRGIWRGPLHGIPWGAKDLLAVRGYPTTWGAMPYKDQIIDEDAAVVQRLDEAGAVLVAKLTLGALAWGDVWFGGKTRNPWNPEQGSSGSSAGPGSAVAAGLVPFAIGSETLGSIVSPSTRNGVTGHRPTFGRVSRRGAMALSWSMDKLGPMARSAEDCALVFQAIHGYDPGDPTTVDVAFHWSPEMDVRGLRVGYLAEAFAQDYPNQKADLETLEVLTKELRIELKPIKLPEDFPVNALLITLEAEAAAAFDELLRSGEVNELVRQTKNSWPQVFRVARFIPAVEYINANRIRTLLMQAMTETLKDIDVFVSPSFGGGTLRITNLTGHPTVVVPNAFHPVKDKPGTPYRQPGSISFVGNLYRDEAALALAYAYQQVTDFHRRRPPLPA